jgi:hypothetical protein
MALGFVDKPLESRMMANCAPWHALRELPLEVVGVRDNDAEVNN